MKNIASKIASTGNDNIILCERGVSFGYHALVNDMRAFPIMAETGYPVMYDVTHSVQQPGAGGVAGEKAGGQSQYVPALARAGVAVGIAAIFIEVHEDPENAPCDGPSATPLKELPELIETLMAFDKLAKQRK
jgi:2-dehydro-3-deoxyphosphooctonate aldolase (KDO 8-P synthase)